MVFKRIFSLFILLGGFILTAQDVRVSLSSQEGYVGLPLQYVITITGSKEADVPSLNGFDGFTLSYQGQSQSSQISVINGKRTQTVKVQFTWQLVPLREGNLEIPSQTLEIEGKTFQTPKGVVNVLPPGKVEGFLLKLDSEQKSVYTNQIVMINLDFYVSREVANLNFTLPGQSRGSQEGRDFLIMESRIPDRSGNDIRQIPLGGRTFYGYVSSRLEGGKQYTILTIPLEIMPLREGELTLEGAAVSFSLEEGTWPRSSLVNRVISAEPLQFTSRQLPREIRESPNGILLARGDLKVRSQLSAREAHPGDPLTLTVELEGLVNADYCEIPPLEDFSTLEEGFSTPPSRSKPKEENGVLTLIQTIRPVSVSSTSVPALEFVYLNLDTNRVSRTSTEPIPLLMSSAGNLSANDLEVFGEGTEKKGMLIANDRGIRQNKSVELVGAAGDQRLSRFTGSWFFLVPLIFPFLAFFIFILGLFVLKLINNVKIRNKKNPFKQFLLSCETEENLFAPLDRYLRDKYFKGRSFSEKELSRLAEDMGAGELLSLYQECGKWQYSGGENRIDRERIITIIRNQERKS